METIRIAGHELAKLIGVNAGTLSRAVKRKGNAADHPVYMWAVKTPTGRVDCYDVPLDIMFDLDPDGLYANRPAGEPVVCAQTLAGPAPEMPAESTDSPLVAPQPPISAIPVADLEPRAEQQPTARSPYLIDRPPMAVARAFGMSYAEEEEGEPEPADGLQGPTESREYAAPERVYVERRGRAGEVVGFLASCVAIGIGIKYFADEGARARNA